MTPPKLLTVPEVRAVLRVSRASAYRLVRGMPHLEIGGRLLVREAALEAFIEARTRQPAVQAPRARRRDARLPALSEPETFAKPIQPRTKPRTD